MQFHMSSASGRWLSIVLAIAAIAGLAWTLELQTGSGAAKPETAALRSATIATGDLARTIRVSGIVTAEKFAALMAPQLRGGRNASGSYGGGKSLVGNAGGSSSSSSSSSPATSSSSTSSSSSSSSTTGSANQGSSAASTNTALNSQPAAAGAPGAPAPSLGAIRGTTNRFGDRQTAQASTNKPATPTGSSSSASSALGTNGLGSTAGNLIGAGGSGGGGGGGGAGGGGGGGSDFTLVLMHVAQPGSHVKKGEIIAEFDRQYQLNRLDDYKATVIQLDADLKKLRADLATAKQAHDQLVGSAKADWDKALLDLKTAEVRSAIEAEDLKLAVQEAEARYKQLAEETKLFEASQRSQILAAEIDRNQAKIELDRATLNVDRMIVHAPMDGIAVMQTIWRGGDYGQVQQGDQIWPGQTFMQVVDPSSMVIMGNLNQVDAESLRLGLKASAHLDAYPGAEFPARVIGVGAMTKAGAWRPNYTREIPVRLKLEQIDPRVIPDLSANADIMLASEKQATLAPLSAVFYERGANPFVFLRTPSGWQRREIELGLRNHLAAVVRSGVSPGDVVATERPATGRAPS
jgi:HlyD family secretion protein